MSVFFVACESDWELVQMAEQVYAQAKEIEGLRMVLDRFKPQEGGWHTRADDRGDGTDPP